MHDVFCQYGVKNSVLRMLRISATTCTTPEAWFPNHADSSRRMQCAARSKSNQGDDEGVDLRP